jgi:hypothetical protein
MSTQSTAAASQNVPAPACACLILLAAVLPCLGLQVEAFKPILANLNTAQTLVLLASGE